MAMGDVVTLANMDDFGFAPTVRTPGSVRYGPRYAGRSRADDTTGEQRSTTPAKARA